MHLLCLAPFVWLLHLYQNGSLGLLPDPVNFITHFTGDWALWTLLDGPGDHASPAAAYIAGIS